MVLYKAIRRSSETHNMVLNAEKVDGISIVQLPPKINSSNSRAFLQDVTPLMAENSRFVFDMSHLTQLDSMGLGTVVSCLKRLRTAGGDLKLCGMSKQILTLFQLVRLHRVLDIFNTREEALASYK